MAEVNNTFECPCKGKCENSGICAQCISHHREIGTVVMCMRPIAQQQYGSKAE